MVRYLGDRESSRDDSVLRGRISRPPACPALRICQLPRMRHRVYLSPGMFGFGRLGSFNYFAHVERELTARFAAAGHELVTYAIDDLPTASIRRRATRLAE